MEDYADPLISVDALIDDVAEWLMTEALGESRLAALAEGTCLRLRAAGIPILRAHFAFTILHPLYSGQGYTWNRDGGMSHEAYEHEPEGHPERFLRSPHYFMMTNEIPSLRRRLKGSEALLDFDVLHELRDLGGTDYYAFAVSFGDSASDGMIGSWLTDRPTGFTERDIRALTRIQRQLGVAFRMMIKSQLAENIVSTYLGTYAGLRVLSGQIRRGDGETIRAAIWYSDLRGSTGMAESLPGGTYIDILNCYFDCMGHAIADAGGEILDFIGDAVLAVFPVQKGVMTERQACRRALAASHDAAKRLARTNAERQAQGLPVLRYGLGLHLGEVMFGNVGTPGRLSYSVTGSSVNRVARLQDLTKKLQSSVVASAAFAEKVPGSWVDLGAHSLEGVPEMMRVMAPKDRSSQQRPNRRARRARQ